LVILALAFFLSGNTSEVLDKDGEAPSGLAAVLEFLDQDPCTKECEEEPACPIMDH
jgi:hypothetical protein